MLSYSARRPGYMAQPKVATSFRCPPWKHNRLCFNSLPAPVTLPGVAQSLPSVTASSRTNEEFRGGRNWHNDEVSGGHCEAAPCDRNTAGPSPSANWRQPPDEGRRTAHGGVPGRLRRRCPIEPWTELRT